MAESILQKHTPDPNREGERCKWPETFISYMNSVKEREKDPVLGTDKPMTDFQWAIAHKYMVTQHGFEEIKDRSVPKFCPGVGVDFAEKHLVVE